VIRPARTPADSSLVSTRWRIVLAALAINLSVGQVYAFSVFTLPLTRALGMTQSTPSDWKLTTIGWTFTLAYVFLGLSAGFAGAWQERVGPRASGLVAACCWSGGFLLSAVGVHWHRIELLYLGYGVLGGCGLGIGFTTPIAALLRWFPERRGLAMGLTIMGFGGGATIAAPLSHFLMERFRSATSVGVAETFVVLGLLYFAAMLWGALGLRLPPPGWTPPASTSPVTRDGGPEHGRSLPLPLATRTRQFWLLWTMLLVNVTAGLGVLGQASAMIQETFDGLSAEAAALFVSLLSLFNMTGRLCWGWLSDQIGRRATYTLFFTVGAALYALVPWTLRANTVVWFVACFAVLMTLYGGGFAAMPAYVADLFGTAHAGAINGRVLTALSAAGLAGPTLVNYLREYQLAHGVPKAQAYNVTMYVLAALLLVGYACNRAVRSLDQGETPLSAAPADPAPTARPERRLPQTDRSGAPSAQSEPAPR
jgi:MFS family permease